MTREEYFEYHETVEETRASNSNIYCKECGTVIWPGRIYCKWCEKYLLAKEEYCPDGNCRTCQANFCPPEIIAEGGEIDVDQRESRGAQKAL